MAQGPPGRRDRRRGIAMVMHAFARAAVALLILGSAEASHAQEADAPAAGPLGVDQPRLQTAAELTRCSPGCSVPASPGSRPSSWTTAAGSGSASSRSDGRNCARHAGHRPGSRTEASRGEYARPCTPREKVSDHATDHGSGTVTARMTDRRSRVLMVRDPTTREFLREVRPSDEVDVILAEALAIAVEPAVIGSPAHLRAVVSASLVAKPPAPLVLGDSFGTRSA